MKRKVQINPELLKEELKKFKLLSEYDFYQEKKEIPEYKDLILGDKELEEADEKAPDDLAPDDANADADAIAGDLGLDDTEDGQDAAPEGGEDFGNAEVDDTNFGGDDTGSAPVEPAEPMPVDDSVEVDVTSLVKGSEEAKLAADRASQNTQALLQKLTDLESRVANMDKVSAKIDGLEKEMIKRNPTPVEKLEMRSLSSYPYSQKLTDYWADKQGAYDVMGNEKKKEYVLTKDDVDANFSPTSIKQSFNVSPDMENPYEEEDI